MPRVRLNAKTVARLRAPTASGEPVLYWDDGPKAVRGFGVLCSGRTDSRSYVVQYDLRAGGRKRTRRMTIMQMSVAEKTNFTLDDARRRAAEILFRVRGGEDPKARRQARTLREVLGAYCETRAHLLRPRTEQHYRETSERYLADWLDRPLTEITREMVERRHKKIAEDVAAAHSEAVAPASGHVSANNAARVLRMLWNFAADRDPTLGPNPVRDRSLWFKVPRRERLVPAESLPKFYAAVAALPSPVHADYLKLLIYCGLRRREAAQLRWTDVDLEKRTLRIPAAVAKSGRKLDLPLSSQVHDMLVARRALGDAEFVFPANSRSGHVEEPKFALRQVEEACGVRVSVHDLRRTFVTVAESCDISPFALRCLVNHAVGGDVTSGYVVMTIERLREPAQRVADKIAELCGVAAPSGANVRKLR